MRFLAPIVAILVTGVAVSQASAQHRGHGPGGPPPPGARTADSLRTLSGPWQLWGHAGAAWLGAPSQVRQRYQAGLGVAFSADRRFADRVAVRARLDYVDLPSTQPTSILIDNIAYAVSADYGHGWFGSSTGGAAVRVWNHLWLEGAGGVGYFDNGFSSNSTFEDLTTGRTISLETRSGWGAVWGSGLRYEFQPTRRDRVLAEFQVAGQDRAGASLRYFSIRFGYRAL